MLTEGRDVRASLSEPGQEEPARPMRVALACVPGWGDVGAADTTVPSDAALECAPGWGDAMPADTTAPADAALECLLADAAEALPVYAQLADVDAPELVRARCGRDLAGCATVLLALRIQEGAHGTEGMRGSEGTRSSEGACGSEGTPLAYAAPGTGVYALLAVDGEPDIAVSTFAALEEACSARGLAWHGGVVVGDADLLPRVARLPRMGLARRRVSEALDHLLVALLANGNAGEKYVRPSLYGRLVGALSRS